MKRVIPARALGRRITVLATAFVLAVSSLTALTPFVLSKTASAATSVSSQASLVSAISGSDSVINITGDFTVSSQVNVNRNLTINGNGHVISPTFTGSSNNDTVLAVTGGSVTVNNLIVDGLGKNGVQGVQIWRASATLNNVTARNNKKAGIHVNGSTVTVNNIKTSNNGANFGGLMISGGALTVNGFSIQSENTNWTGAKMDIYRTGGTLVDSNSQYSNWLNLGIVYTLKPLVAPATPTGLGFGAANQCGGRTNVNYAQPMWSAVSGAESYDYQALYNGAVVYTGSFASQHPGGTFGGGENGAWGFQVRSVSGNGLKSDWSTVCDIMLDTQAPDATFTHSNNNDNTLVNTDVTSTLTATEAIQTPDGWALVEGSDGTKFTKVSTENHKEDMTITDLAGNSKVVRFEVKRIDKEAPAFNFGNGSLFNTASVEVIATEQNIGNTLKVDGVDTAHSNTKPNYKVTVTGEGSHVVTATDKAGNSTTVTFIIDTTPITVTANTFARTGNTITPNVITNETPASQAWTLVSGPVGGVTISDTQALAPTFTVLRDGTYIFRLEVFDAVGNASFGLFNFTYDTPGTVVNNLGPGTGGGSGDDEDATDTLDGFDGPAFIPQSTNPSQLGAQDEADGTPEVKGTSTTPDNLAAAIGANNTDGNALGLAWYWWLLIIAGGSTIIWGVVSALRGRPSDL